MFMHNFIKIFKKFQETGPALHENLILREFTNVCKYSVNIWNFMRYVFTIVCLKWCIRQDFTTDYKLSKFSVNVEAIFAGGLHLK